MDRVSFFIDGFNVYHSLKENPLCHKFLWIDYYSLAQRFVRKNDRIADVFYFTAYATWKKEAFKRHRLLTDALKNRGVRIILGKFKEKDRFCKICNGCFKAHEEKQTDVNIAVCLFREAVLDTYDTAVIVTNDTDLIPAVKAVKEVFPHKKTGVLFPLNRWSEELKNGCDFWRKIETKDLSKSQFPDDVVLPSGVSLTRPLSWK